MYKDMSVDTFLTDLSQKEVEMGGGSLIGLNLSSICALVSYIANLTIGKKKYQNVENEAKEILKLSEALKEETVLIIDRDKEILEEILLTYKSRENSAEDYENTLTKAVEFSFEVLGKSMEVLKLVDRISKIGNLMMVSDFEIGAYMAYSCVESSITNIKINLMNNEDENYVEKMRNKYLNILDEAYEIKENILKLTKEKLS